MSTAKHVLVRNLSRPEIVPVRAQFCESFLCRLRGLMLRRLAPGEGLLLVQPSDSRMDSSIHMLFMVIDLAVVWINSARQVVDVQPARAWRPAYWSRQPARYVLETTTDRLNDFAVGDRIDFEEAPHP